MSTLRLIPLGVGDAFSAVHYTTSFLLGHDDFWILLDCPHPIRKMLREATTAAGRVLDLPDIEAVLLSHLHADHSSGLEDFAYFSYYALKKRAKLLTHPEAAARVWDSQLAAGMDSGVEGPERKVVHRAFSEFFDLTVIPPDAPITFGPFRIESRPTLHAIPTCAYRITAGDLSLGFSADTAFDRGLIDWLAPCDLILHEGTDGPTGGVHTSVEELRALPDDLLRKVKLFHYRDAYDTSNPLPELLRQGHCYEVHSRQPL